ncbi:MAG TPA: phosphotransferase family protein [Porticoccaceae bacterium]|nr:phosphotransferase family protein [Porticoccaceae bacterium]
MAPYTPTPYTPTLALRASPTPEWIATIRARFPVERALDAVLTRKLEQRAEPREQQMDFATLEPRLLAYLRGVTGEPGLRIANLRRLTGGASKEQFTFDLWRPRSGARQLILRMDPLESVVETHRLREAQILRAMRGVVPVPEVLWVEHEPDALERPFLIAGFLEGIVQPEGGGKMTGLGMYFPPPLRAALKDQFVAHLAAIHRLDWQGCDLSSYDPPTPGTNEANRWSLGLWERVWHEDSIQAHPVVEYAGAWLKANMPRVDNPVVVHGDYRSGNFMFTPEGRINAVLDWELCHLGDYHEDLAYVGCQMLGSPDERGQLLACGLLSFEELLEKYATLSGLRVDRNRLRWYDVFTYYKTASIAATGLRVAHDRRTHLDAMMNLIGGLGNIAVAQLARLLT